MPFWVKLFGLGLENLSNLWQILHLAGLIQLYVYILVHREIQLIKTFSEASFQII